MSEVKNETEVYEKNYLDTVALVMNFSAIDSFSLKTINEFFDNLPLTVSQPQISKNITLNIVNGDKGFESGKTENDSYLVTLDDGTTITLASESISFVQTKYKSFTELKSIYQPVIDSLIEKFRIDKFSRVGLRYINDITLSGGDIYDWDGYIKQPYLSSLNEFANNSGYKLLRNMQNTILSVDPDTLISINYGLFNPNYPAEPTVRQFILDLDCFNAFGVDASDYNETISKFNDALTKAFETCIDDKLREELR